jgi:hypothetical protein
VQIGQSSNFRTTTQAKLQSSSNCLSKLKRPYILSCHTHFGENRHDRINCRQSTSKTTKYEKTELLIRINESKPEKIKHVIGEIALYHPSLSHSIDIFSHLRNHQCDSLSGWQQMSSLNRWTTHTLDSFKVLYGS